VVGHHRWEPGAVRQPGGLGSLGADTIFLLCTSGLPDTSPAGDGGHARSLLSDLRPASAQRASAAGAAAPAAGEDQRPPSAPGQ